MKKTSIIKVNTGRVTYWLARMLFNKDVSSPKNFYFVAHTEADAQAALDYYADKDATESSTSFSLYRSVTYIKRTVIGVNMCLVELAFSISHGCYRVSNNLAPHLTLLIKHDLITNVCTARLSDEEHPLHFDRLPVLADDATAKACYEKSVDAYLREIHNYVQLANSLESKHGTD